jgi:hypothetical protein
MPSSMRLVVAVLLAGCEHVDDLELDIGSPEMPVATAEVVRLNIDAVPGVAPVRVTTLEDPRFPVPRERTIQHEDAPPEPSMPMTEAHKWYLGLTGTERKTVLQICGQGWKDPCFGIVRSSDTPPRTKMEVLMATLGERGRWSAAQFCWERNPGLVCDTPLVVSFDGEPVVFESSDATFAFQPGIPVHTDWPSAATPWIAIDLDGDGAITSGAELFGDATRLPSGEQATHGFEALAALDANRDGVLNAKDPAFAKLLLWADRDGDRKSAKDELRWLSSVVIAIPLAHELEPRCRRGNCEGERGALSWRDATGRARAGAVIDVYLKRR